MRKYFLYVFVVISTFICTGANAQTWEPLGPYAPMTLWRVARTDSVIVGVFITGEIEKVYRSSDRGISWELCDLPYPNSWDKKFNAVYAVGNLLYAINYDSEFFLSTDHGRSWLKRSQIIDGQTPRSSNSLFQINSQLFVAWGDKYYTTNDSGLTWFFAKAPLNGDIVGGYVIGNNIVAITASDVYISDDRAGSWKKIPAVKSDDDYTPFTDIAVQGSNLYVSTHGVIYHSLDGGASWQEPFKIDDITGETRIAASATHLWIADDTSIYYSTDALSTVKRAVKPSVYRFMNTLEVLDTLVFVSSYGGGAYLTSNNAQNWSFLQTGFQPSEMSNVWTNDNVLLGGTGSGLLMRSTTNGMTWEPSFHSTTIASGSNQFAATFALEDTIITTTDEEHYVLRSGNNGVSWVENANSAPWYEVNDIDGREGLWVAVITRNGSVYRTTNKGISWVSVFGDYMDDNFRMIALHDTSFFAASTRGGGIWRSNKDATKFVKLFDVGLPIGTCYSVASNGKTLFAGYYQSLFRSRDSGATWEEIDIPFTGEVYDIKCYGNNVVILERTSVSNMIYYSPNECDTVITLTPGGFTSRETWEVDINNKFLFAQTKDKGIFRYNYLPLKSVKNEVAQNSFTLYPNPAQTVVNIEAVDKANAIVYLVDMLGREVRTGKLSEQGKLTLDSSELPNGVYTVVLEHKGTTSKSTIVVTK